MSTASTYAESPFASGLDIKRYFASAAHNETLARLEYLLERRSRVGLLNGPAGSGKSLVLAIAASDWRKAGHVVANLNAQGLCLHDVLWQVGCQWKCPVLAQMPEFALWHALSDALAVHRCERRATVLLVDDADQASPEVLSALLRLVHQGDVQQPRLTLVFATRKPLPGEPGRDLTARAELRLELGAWDVAETRDYLQSHLHGQTPQLPQLDMAATERLHALAQGLPRGLNQLTNLVLLAAASEGLEVVDVATVDKVYRELFVAPVL